MDDIIRASELSAGAVYSYYPSKEELILAAVTTSLTGLRERIEPIFDAELQPPDAFVEKILEAISDFTVREGYDLKRIALLGWGEAQRNERLRETMRGLYLAFRARLAAVAVEWSKAGLVRKDAATSDVANVVLAEILGFVVLSAILGDVEPKGLARGLRDLATLETVDGP